MKKIEISMIFFYKCIILKVTKQIVNKIIVITDHLKLKSTKMEVNQIQELRSDGCCS